MNPFSLNSKLRIFLLLLLPLLAAPLYAFTALSEHMLANDTSEEIEPAVIGQMRSGVEYDVAVYMGFDPSVAASDKPKLYCSTWTSLGSSAVNSISEHPDYDKYFDPVLTQNPSTNRIYLVALGESSTSANTAVLLWYSDDAGSTWTAPTPIATAMIGFNGSSLDKPSATVAPDGTVYAVWLRVAGSQSTIEIANTANGATATIMTSTARIADPQLVMDNVFERRRTSQFAYVIWEEEDVTTRAMTIRTAKLVASTSFGSPTQLSSTITGIASVMFLPLTSVPKVLVRANTNPVVRLDRARHRIVMAWHDETDSNTHDVRVASMSTDPLSTRFDSWGTVLTLSHGAGHNIEPGVDVDPNTGNAFVSYYWFPSGQSSYSNYGAYVSFDSNGTPSSIANNTITSRTGDVQYYSADADGNRYIGDYHDVAYINGKFLCAHILILGTGNGNPWAFGVTP